MPVQLPIGEEKNFKGVVDLVSMKALTFATDGSGTLSVGEIPGEMADVTNTAREVLIEMVAEADDALMEKFFEAGTLSQVEPRQRSAHRHCRSEGVSARLHVSARQYRYPTTP